MTIELKNTHVTNSLSGAELEQYADAFATLKQEIGTIIAGNKDTIHYTLIALLSQGHILFEGPPGVAKTTLVKTLSEALGLNFKRIQFTPDLLPSDLVGSLVYNQKTQEFETRKGPLFANLILADEINRAPAKVQAALLEAMQEHQVTIGSTTFLLDEPFFVFATQNPLEQAGTYALPEAQLDRFMFKILVDYPSRDEEKEIIIKSKQKNKVREIINRQTVMAAQELIERIYIDEAVLHYIVDLVMATRNPQRYGLADLQELIAFGVSPRATLAIERAARAHAFLKKRSFVLPDDVKFVIKPILRHRLLLSYEALSENIRPDHLIEKIIEKIPTP